MGRYRHCRSRTTSEGVDEANVRPQCGEDEDPTQGRSTRKGDRCRERSECSHGSHHAPDNPAKNKETAQNIRPPRSTLLTLEHPRLPLQPLSPHRPKRLARVAHELKVSSIVLRSPASIALMSVKYRIRSASALLDSRGWPECSRGLVCLSAECAGSKPHRTTRGDDIPPGLGHMPTQGERR